MCAIMQYHAILHELKQTGMEVPAREQEPAGVRRFDRYPIG